MPALILIRGGGDLASGVALRLHRVGLQVLISELAQPLAVRRAVSFAEAIYTGQTMVEEATGRLVGKEQALETLEAGEIPVLIDQDASILAELPVPMVIDARLAKHPPAPLPVDVLLHVGLGPGFHAGRNCHAVVETRRSHTLGRVYWHGTTQPDSGQPEGDPRRVLRAPADGQLVACAHIGDHLEEGQLVAVIADQYSVTSPFKGVLRGLIHPGLHVTKGLKIGDVDLRDQREDCFLVSDKALAVSGGVLEAILSKEELRKQLWD